ncbi:MAG: ADP-ribose diphosphatase [Desulfuromonas sp.]|nr:MAG: ADP-ribose diphosphatase [Desulfuromonas sp.]
MLTAKDVKIFSREQISKGFLKIFRIKLTHRLFAGGEPEPFVRELMERGNAVAVVLYDERHDKVVMVEQFRVGALEDPESPWLLEFPAGVVKEGESDEDVAMRECEEEVGRAPKSLHPITKCYLTPGGSSEKIAIFYGPIDSEGLDDTIKGLDCENEDIRVRTLDLDEALEMTRDGRIRNASTALGLYWLAGELGRKP